MPTFNNVSKIKNMPISRLLLYYPTSSPTPQLYTFYNIEEGSSVIFTPITVPNDQGGETIVAWEQKVSVTILENDYGTKAGLLSDMASLRLSDVDIQLKPLSGQQNGATMWVSPDTSPALKVKDWSLLFNIESSSETPRLNISITGLMSVELFQSSEFVAALFSEGDGF